MFHKLIISIASIFTIAKPFHTSSNLRVGEDYEEASDRYDLDEATFLRSESHHTKESSDALPSWKEFRSGKTSNSRPVL